MRPPHQDKFDEEYWKHIRQDPEFGTLLKQYFSGRRREQAPTQTRFVDLSNSGELSTLNGEVIKIGEKDIQRLEQGRLQEISFERFSLLIRTIGLKPSQVLATLGYTPRNNVYAKGTYETLGTGSSRQQPVTHSFSQMGEAFILALGATGSVRRVRTMPNPDPFRLRLLNWQTFGEGIELLAHQIRNVGYHVTVDACIGINDAGLAMATFLNYSVLKRVHLGHVRCGMYRGRLQIDREHSIFPNIKRNPAIMLCDFEIKHAEVLPKIVKELRERYNDPSIYFSVFGAMTECEDLRIKSLSELASASFLPQIRLEEVFIACTMHPPGIEPPLDLK
ncbi:hypothetical protein [Ruegeria sp. HKCCD8929]|uniref:hypothetical protein n=1 Tax=Ruegeria sp. HKCCD8929 TaxID=2683006 RepID=UPI0014888462|nr:hypothetical protein [Ruegeria sp. HKCCD8929]